VRSEGKLALNWHHLSNRTLHGTYGTWAICLPNVWTYSPFKSHAMSEGYAECPKWPALEELIGRWVL